MLVTMITKNKTLSYVKLRRNDFVSIKKRVFSKKIRKNKMASILDIVKGQVQQQINGNKLRDLCSRKCLGSFWIGQGGFFKSF